MGFERSGSELQPLTGCQSRDDRAASCRENPNPYLSAKIKRTPQGVLFCFLSMGFERSGSELQPLTGCQSRDDRAASCRENPNPYLSAKIKRTPQGVLFCFLSMGFERSGSELQPLTGCQSRDDRAASCRENSNPYLSAIVSNEY